MKKTFIFIVLVIVLIAWFSPHFWGGKAVEVTKPVRGGAVQAVYATGTVEATVMLPISPRVSARLMEMSVDEGSEIKKGQVLAKFEDFDMQSNLQQLQAKANFAEKMYVRNADLLKKGVLPKSEYDRARADMESAKAAVAKAKAEADYMMLTAPADGRIIKRDGEIGQLIPANQPLFWISCCASLRISAEVDEEDISQVQPNQKVLIRADAFPNKVFNGKVVSITPKGDPVSRSYRVRVEFSEETPLLIGMTAETNIIISEKADAMLVPSSAISQGFVWAIRDGKLVKIPVEIGAKGKEQAEIISGIGMDDLVVVSPSPTLKEGEQISQKFVEQKQP